MYLAVSGPSQNDMAGSVLFAYVRSQWQYNCTQSTICTRRRKQAFRAGQGRPGQAKDCCLGGGSPSDGPWMIEADDHNCLPVFQPSFPAGKPWLPGFVLGGSSDYAAPDRDCSSLFLFLGLGQDSRKRSGLIHGARALGTDSSRDVRRQGGREAGCWWLLPSWNAR
jgi:hypothetical protein